MPARWRAPMTLLLVAALVALSIVLVATDSQPERR